MTTTTKRRNLRRSDQGFCERVLRAARRVVARLSIKRYSRDRVKNEGVKSNGPRKESYALARCLCKRIPPRVTLFASMLRFFLGNSVDSSRSSSMATVWFMGEKSRWKWPWRYAASWKNWSFVGFAFSQKRANETKALVDFDGLLRLLVYFRERGNDFVMTISVAFFSHDYYYLSIVIIIFLR